VLGPTGLALEVMLNDIRLANELADALGQTPIGDLVQEFHAAPDRTVRTHR